MMRLIRVVKIFFQNSELWQFPCVKGLHSLFAVRYFQMKKLSAFASGIRLNAVLCCGAAVLLSACGAGVSDPVNGIQSHTAAELTTSTAQPAANNAAAMPSGAEATPAVADAATPATPAAPAATPATPAAAPAARPSGAAANIEPAYDSSRQAAGTAGFSDQTDAPVQAAQDIAATACDTGTCQH
jgi:hypothetical protein